MSTNVVQECLVIHRILGSFPKFVQCDKSPKLYSVKVAEKNSGIAAHFVTTQVFEAGTPRGHHHMSNPLYTSLQVRRQFQARVCQDVACIEPRAVFVKTSVYI